MKEPRYYYEKITLQTMRDPKQALRDWLTTTNMVPEFPYEIDVALWYGTLIKAEGDLGTFYRRLLSTLFYGGLLYKSRDGSWKPWQEMKAPLAAVLSHGSGVLIQLPKSGVKESAEFWNWLLAGTRPPDAERTGSGISHLNKPPERVYSDRCKCFQEARDNKILFGLSGIRKRLDMAMGGAGNRNPWTGKTIQPNGEHGALYLHYIAPTTGKPGAILVEMRSAAPGKTGQTGYRNTGNFAEEEFSATGGGRWALDEEQRKKNMFCLPDSDLLAPRDCLLIDLSGDGGKRDIRLVMDNAQSLSLDSLTNIPAPPTTINTEKVFLSQSPSPRPTGPALGKAAPPCKGNEVTFLMDGEEYFSVLLHEMAEIRQALEKGPLRVSVRFAFWMISPKFTDFMKRVEEDLVAQGCPVDIIVWYPDKTNQLVKQPKEIAAGHEEMAKTLTTLKPLEGSGKTAGRVRVYLERYEGWLGASNHQKIAIFTVNGQRTVLVGGLNIAPYYFDTEKHDFNNNDWHDTAVRLRGPVTDHIDQEWLRRWQRTAKNKEHVVTSEKKLQLEQPENTTVQNTYNGTGGDLKAASRLGRVNRELSLRSYQGVNVQIALNRTTKTTRLNQIKEELIYRIDRASKYLYMENVAITDPDIGRAIYNRMKACPSLKVVIITDPSPCDLQGAPKKAKGDKDKPSETKDHPTGFLTRRTWLQIALRLPQQQPATLEYDPGKGAKAVRINRQQWQQVADNAKTGSVTTSNEANIANRWLENDYVTVEPDSRKIAFPQITSLDCGFYFYTPVKFLGIGSDGTPEYKRIEIHSKLAIIDGRYLIVGSANWTYRSMNYDGEITTLSENEQLATASLARLLSHYDLGGNLTIDDVPRRALDNIKIFDSILHGQGMEKLKAKQAARNKLLLLPIEHPRIPWLRFQRTVPTEPITNFTWY